MISVENRKISPPTGTGAGVKKLQWWGHKAEKEVWRYRHPSGYNPPTWLMDRQKDGRTDTGRKQRLRERIASRGKNGTRPAHSYNRLLTGSSIVQIQPCYFRWMNWITGSVDLIFWADDLTYESSYGGRERGACFRVVSRDPNLTGGNQSYQFLPTRTHIPFNLSDQICQCNRQRGRVS